MLRSSSLCSPAALSRFLLTAIVGLSLDLWSKYEAFTRLQDGVAYPFIPGWLEFEVTRNHGAVFGLGQGRLALFLIVSFGAIAFLGYLFAVSEKRWFYQLVLGLLMAGVLGNLYDRMVFGSVRDMIHILPRWPHLYPWIFNVADSFLCVGVGLMVIYSLIVPTPHSPANSPAKTTADTTTPSNPPIN